MVEISWISCTIGLHLYFSNQCSETIVNFTCPNDYWNYYLFCIAKILLSLPSICVVVLPFLSLYHSLLCQMDMPHYLWCLLLSAYQRVRCLVCYGQVCDWSIQRSATRLSFSITFSGVCSYHLAAFENPYLLCIVKWRTTPTLSCR